LTETSTGQYDTAVLFVPLVQVVDYATYPFEELSGPIVPQTSRQERVRLTRIKLECEYLFGTPGSPAVVWQFLTGWYLCKFSLAEISNAIANIAGGGMIPYDPLDQIGGFLFQQPVIRFGHDFTTHKWPGIGTDAPGMGWDRTHHISINAPLRTSLETDEELYLVLTTSASAIAEQTFAYMAFQIQSRVQMVT